MQQARARTQARRSGRSAAGAAATPALPRAERKRACIAAGPWSVWLRGQDL